MSKTPHARVPAEGREISFPKGTNVFAYRPARRGICWLRSGHVRLIVNDAIIDHLAPGSFFGEWTALVDTPPPKTTALSLAPVSVVVFSRKDFFRRVRQVPGFTSTVLQNLFRRLSRYEKSIARFVTAPAEARLASLLFELAPPKGGWVRLPFALTNPDLAKMIGSSRWRVSYFLNRFQRLGWLRRSHGLWVERRKLKAFVEKETVRR
jgi:CRP/FNR family transcriptional regulator, cyclic AMP receptor protein